MDSFFRNDSRLESSLFVCVCVCCCVSVPQQTSSCHQSALSRRGSCRFVRRYNRILPNKKTSVFLFVYRSGPIRAAPRAFCFFTALLCVFLCLSLCILPALSVTAPPAVRTVMRRSRRPRTRLEVWRPSRLGGRRGRSRSFLPARPDTKRRIHTESQLPFSCVVLMVFSTS